MAREALVFLCFTLFASALGKNVPTETVIDCNMGHLRTCFKLLVADSILFGLPATAEAAQQQCKTAVTTIECFRNYTSTCVSGFFQSFFFAAGTGYPKYYAEYCKPQSPLMLQYLKNATCSSEIYKSDKMLSILNDFVVGMNECFHRPYPERLLTFGCSYQRWYVDTKKLLETQCGKEAFESFHTYLKIAFHGMPFVLSNHLGPETAKCKPILPPRGTKYIPSDSDFGVVKFLNEVVEAKKIHDGF